MRRLILIIAVILQTVSLFGQGKQIKAGDRNVKKFNYTKAIKNYKEAIPLIEESEQKKKVLHKIGTCYFEMNNYKEASRWFEDAISDFCDHSSWYVNYADALAFSGNLEQAIDVYEKALDLGEGAECKQKLNSAQQSFDVETHGLDIVRPVKELNSSNSDYGPAWFGNELVFASTRSENSSKIDGRTGQSYCDLFVSKYDTLNKKWSEPVPLDSKLNTSYNEGTFTFNNKGNEAYWMECNDRKNHCVIKKAKFNPEDKSWYDVKEVKLNKKSYSLGHPSFDSVSNVLYFVSEMEGGKGKKDIWKVNLRNDGSWGEPKNLGVGVNSDDDELFPFVQGDSILFFASNRKSGLGGLDIYFSVKRGNSFGKAKHLESPYNSYADDFGFVMCPKGQDGFLSSNRDNENSDDIFFFRGFPVSMAVRGTVKDGHSGHLITDARVLVKNIETNYVDTLYTNEKGKWYYPAGFFSKYEFIISANTYRTEKRNLKTPSKKSLLGISRDTTLTVKLFNKQFPCGVAGRVINRESKKPMQNVRVLLEGGNGVNAKVMTDRNGQYLFDSLCSNVIYKVKIKKKGYFQEMRMCKIPDLKKSVVCSKGSGYDMDFELTRMEKSKEFVLSNIYYDFNKASLRETSKIELNKLVSLLRENPEVKIRINSHTDARGNNNYNDDLSQKRAQSVVNYLLSKHIPKQQLSAKGFGKRNLLISKARSEDEHQANRRTTFEVVDFMSQDEVPKNSLVGNVSDDLIVVKQSENIKNPAAEKEATQEAETVKVDLSTKDFPVKEAHQDQKEINVANLEKTNSLCFHVQLMSTSRKLSDISKLEQLISGHSEFRIYENQLNGVYKYEVGPAYDLKGIGGLKKLIQNNGHKGGFTVAYYNGKRISMKEAKQLLNK
ncbi:MAG: OmpA family protein [Bacteroidales bacterium]